MKRLVLESKRKSALGEVYKISKILIGFFYVFVVTLGCPSQNLKIEEILAKHRDSIATPERLSAIKNMVLLGTSDFQSKLPQRRSVGKVAIVSDASNLLFICSYVSESYPPERIGIFDGVINVPFVQSDMRSLLGDFVQEHPEIIRAGVFDGAMSRRWALLEENLHKSKVFAAGMKKIDGKNTYAVDFFGEGSSESLSTRLYFDAKTFQHVRSVYHEEYSGKEAKFGTLGNINGYTIELIENFSDFHTFENVTLPTVLKSHYFGTSSTGTFEYDWQEKINEVKFNQPLKEGFFNFK